MTVELGEKESIERSLTYKINSEGPRMESCGTRKETIALKERQREKDHEGQSRRL